LKPKEWKHLADVTFPNAEVSKHKELASGENPEKGEKGGDIGSNATQAQRDIGEN
jgi:hypothetical protein